MQQTYGAVVAAGLMAVGLALAPPAQATGGVPSCAMLGAPCLGNRVVFVFDLSKRFFNLQPCTCAGATLTICNPDATISPGAPTGAGFGVPPCVASGGILTEVPTMVEGVKNPGTFFCTVIGGRRTCYQR